MKTATTSKTFPNAKMITFYIATVMAFCMLNCLALKVLASDSRHTYADTDYQMSLIEEDPEASLQVHNWMLDFNLRDVEDVVRPGIILTQDMEKQLKILTNEHDPESALECENWMLDVNSWGKPAYIPGK